MALQIFGFGSIGAGIRANLLAADDVYIGANATVGSTDTDAVQGTGSFHEVTVFGDVIGADDGVSLGDDAALDSNQEVLVGVGGSISGSVTGLEINANGNNIVNHGTISGGTAMSLEGTGTGTTHIVNYGAITGTTVDGIDLRSGSSETIRFINYGTLRGESRAYDAAGNGETSIDLITNRGSITGDVRLGNSNDVFDNRGGTIEGVVEGGEGNDIFFAGASAETFDGEGGTDTINLQSGLGGTIDLTGGATGTGLALGDIYTNIENVSGSLAGVDIVIGSTAVNVLFGFGGTDALNGGGGNDFLTGNAGADTLVGGTGNDFYQYLAASEGGDLILDYGNVLGNDDSFRIFATGFGGGLVAGVLAANQFQNRADNVAQDADDRFIFRNTDQTLWFDVDGNAAGGPVLIADMQAGVVLTAADIIMF